MGAKAGGLGIGPAGAQNDLVASWIEQRHFLPLVSSTTRCRVATLFYYSARGRRLGPRGAAMLAPEPRRAAQFTRRIFNSVRSVRHFRHRLTAATSAGSSPLHEVLRTHPGAAAAKRVVWGAAAIRGERARLRAIAVSVLGWDELRLTRGNKSRRRAAPAAACGGIAPMPVRPHEAGRGPVLMLSRRSRASIASAGEEASCVDYLAGEIFQKSDAHTSISLLQPGTCPAVGAHRRAMTLCPIRGILGESTRDLCMAIRGRSPTRDQYHDAARLPQARAEERWQDARRSGSGFGGARWNAGQRPLRSALSRSTTGAPWPR